MRISDWSSDVCSSDLFLLRLLLSFAFGGIAPLVLYYVVPQTYIGRGVLALSLMIGFLGIYLLRMGSYHLFGAEVFKRRVLVYGAGTNADLINSRLRRSEEHTSELQSIMRNSYAVFFLKK